MTTLNHDQQMELGFNGSSRLARRERRERRLARAAWWFGRMRAAVDNATGHSAGPAARPEQTFLTGAYRQIKL
jgi:hypothetical protein